MSSETEHNTVDAQVQCKKMLDRIYQVVEEQRLLDALENLPSYSEYDFEVFHGSIVIDIGTVYPYDFSENIRVYPSWGQSFPHACRGGSRSIPFPKFGKLGELDPQSIRKKGAICWDADLYRGLFTSEENPQNIDRRTAALVRYYFIQWGAKVQPIPEVDNFPSGEDIEIDLDAFCEALHMLSHTNGYRQAVQRKNDTTQAGPSDNFRLERGDVVEDGTEEEGHDHSTPNILSLLERLRDKKLDLDSLPELSTVHYQTLENEDQECGPLRIYLGESTKEKYQGKIWAYFWTQKSGANTKSEKVSVTQRFETYDENGEYKEEFSTISMGRRNTLTFEEPFCYALQNPGRYDSYNIVHMARYYYYLARRNEDQDIYEHEIDAIFGVLSKYLRSAIKDYKSYTQNPGAQSGSASEQSDLQAPPTDGEDFDMLANENDPVRPDRDQNSDAIEHAGNRPIPTSSVGVRRTRSRASLPGPSKFPLPPSSGTAIPASRPSPLQPIHAHESYSVKLRQDPFIPEEFRAMAAAPPTQVETFESELQKLTPNQLENEESRLNKHLLDDFEKTKKAKTDELTLQEMVEKAVETLQDVTQKAQKAVQKAQEAMQAAQEAAQVAQTAAQEVEAEAQRVQRVNNDDLYHKKALEEVLDVPFETTQKIHAIQNEMKNRD